MGSYVNTFPCPPSVNAAYRNLAGVGRVKTGDAKKWERAATQCLMLAPRRELKGKVTAMYEFGKHPDNRRRDLSNFMKLLEDFLTDARIIEDDSLIHEIYAKWTPDVRAGDVRVSLMEKMYG